MSTIQPSPFSELLRHYRSAAGLTQEELAEQSGISVRAVSDLERGVNRRPYKTTVTRLGSALALADEDLSAFLQASRAAGRGTVPPATDLEDNFVRAESGSPVDNMHSPHSSAAAPSPSGRRQALPQVHFGWLAAFLLAVVVAVGTVLAWGHIVGMNKSPATGTNPSTSLHGKGGAWRRQDQPLIRAAVYRSDRMYLKSRACACDAGLATVKTGPDLHKYQVQIQNLRHRKQRIKTTFHFLRVISIGIESPTAGTVRADKDETAEVFVAARLVEICSGPYQVQYHVIRTGAGWKVDDTRLLSGQACHTL